MQKPPAAGQNHGSVLCEIDALLAEFLRVHAFHMDEDEINVISVGQIEVRRLLRRRLGLSQDGFDLLGHGGAIQCPRKTARTLQRIQNSVQLHSRTQRYKIPTTLC